MSMSKEALNVAIGVVAVTALGFKVLTVREKIKQLKIQKNEDPKSQG